MSETIAIWFLVVSYTQLWPDQHGMPQHNIDVDAVYLSQTACLRAADHMVIHPYEKSYAGPVAHNYNVVKRCKKVEAPDPMDNGHD